MDRSKNMAPQSHQKQQVSRHQQQQPMLDHRQHYHINERPMNSVRYMDKRSKSILCNGSGIIVAEMVYRCLICKSIFETPLDCRTHFRCFHKTQYQNLEARNQISP